MKPRAPVRAALLGVLIGGSLAIQHPPASARSREDPGRAARSAAAGRVVRRSGDELTTRSRSTTAFTRSVAVLGSTIVTTSTEPPIPTTTLGSANDLTGGARVRGAVGTGGSHTYFFSIVAETVLVAETSDGKDKCDVDTTLELSKDGIVLATDNDSGTARCSRIVKRLVTAGTYDLKVAGFQGQSVPQYVLDVEFVDTECGNGIVELEEPCDDGNVAAGDCCSPTCQKAADGTPCNDGRQCDGTDTCLAGRCSVHAANPCPGENGDKNCMESCSDEFPGCDYPDPDWSPCNNTLFCDGVDRCFAGACTEHAGDPCRGPDGDGNCAETCNETSDSCKRADPNLTVCDDGRFCNGTDQCNAGGCTLHSGNPCIGADGDANCSESCREPVDKCNGPDPNGSACNDGFFCTGTDSCLGGTCSAHTGNACPGPDDDSNCVESCNESSHLCTTNDVDGSPCNDGIFCNGTDTCVSGACTGHTGNPCPGPDGDAECAESCDETTDTCTAYDGNGAACNDALFCNGADTCVSGACTGHVGSPCPGADGDGNCSESCAEASDTCVAADPDGSSCSDGLFCNGAESCLGGSCGAHPGNPCPGADGDGDCSETCSENADACTAPDPNGSACNDGLQCNGSDTCSAGFCTQHTTPVCQGADGDSDCSESCSDTAGGCDANDPVGSPCNDGIFCNGADTCSGGACSVHAGDPCPGPDGDGNCAETCNESSDSCTTNDPNDSSCNDGLFCNGVDSCEGGACTLHAGDPCPGPDGDGNCAESCSENAAACTAADPQGSACVGGDPCRIGKQCNASGACSGGTLVNCDDNDACTTDTCHESEPHCTHAETPVCPPTTTTTEESSRACGDASGDDHVTAGDALLVLKAAVGGAQCNGFVCACDANANGTLTASDAQAVLRAAVGIPSTLHCNC